MEEGKVIEEALQIAEERREVKEERKRYTHLNADSLHNSKKKEESLPQ